MELLWRSFGGYEGNFEFILVMGWEWELNFMRFNFLLFFSSLVVEWLVVNWLVVGLNFIWGDLIYFEFKNLECKNEWVCFDC